MIRRTKCLLIVLFACLVPRGASALIMGGEGNKPIADPGWPKGAAAIFNHNGRVAWWEGPPFGGGQWHAECQGDAKTLSAVLADFAKIEAKVKRVVLHDGAGHSFWLAPNNEPAKLAAAKVDWVFMVWQGANWERLRKMPVNLNPTDPGDSTPPTQIDVFTAGIRWSDVKMPAGIEVVDQRLEAHGFTVADGVVIEGKVTELSTGHPMVAKITLQRVEPRKQGGYSHPTVAETKTDALGHWVLKKVPSAWVRVVVEADGFVPRVAGYARFDDQPRWQSYDSGLARAVAVAGRVTDETGQPLANVDVRLDVEPQSGGRYESPAEYKSQTDADGRFRTELVPAGKAKVWVHKPGYYRAGLGLPITAPNLDVAMQMSRSASIRVTVDFTGKQRPEGFMVQLTPEGGDVVGSYGGSGNIDPKNQMTFENVPPGRYFVSGQPNPGSRNERTEPVTVDPKGGQTVEVTLKAK